MKFRTLAMAALALLLPFSAAACSKDSTGDLSVNEMSKELQKQGAPKKQADCVAQALKKADFTKSDLDNMAKDGGKGVDTNSAKFKTYMGAATKCLGIEMPTTTAP